MAREKRRNEILQCSLDYEWLTMFYVHLAHRWSYSYSYFLPPAQRSTGDPEITQSSGWLSDPYVNYADTILLLLGHLSE